VERDLSMRKVKQQRSGGFRLESLVAPQHVTGSGYQADPGIPGGRTTGRTRNYTSGHPRGLIKSVWLYPFCRGVGKRFAMPTTHTV